MTLVIRPMEGLISIVDRVMFCAFCEFNVGLWFLQIQAIQIECIFTFGLKGKRCRQSDIRKEKNNGSNLLMKR